ncbi:MAG: histidine phosphatase family protein [Rudaea sp.]
MTASSSKRVWLIRHAQASFGSADYDVLSARGHEQSERLAAWLVSHPELNFAHVVRGTLRRHKETLAAIERAFTSAKREFPASAEDANWNEFDYEAIVRAYASSRDDDLVSAASNDPTNRRAVHALLAAALREWALGQLDGVGETWQAFGARVAAARQRVLSATPGKILVISSAGPIAQCAQAALGCDAERTVALNIALRNTAISEFRVGHGWDMQIWNMLPHLASPADREVVTYY